MYPQFVFHVSFLKMGCWAKTNWSQVVNFQNPSFDSDLFWARLVSLLQAGCPIGCGTSALTLEELGLVGQHAYSVLAAEDSGFCDMGDARRVKVRNPWGEWTRREQDELLAQLGVAIIPSDGCFWMNYSDFIRGFACCDICYARDGWHSRSFDLAFDGAVGVGARSALRLRSERAMECWIMGIQPTERGKQMKRPPGYYLNDLSLLVVDQESGEVVAAFLGGARRDVSCSVMMEAHREYLAIPVSFRANRGPFVLRVYAASPVEVLLELPSAEMTWRSMHSLLTSPLPKTQKTFQRMKYDFGVGQVVVVEADSMALGLVINKNPTSLMLHFLAAGNHTVLRNQSGMQEGCPDEERNQRQRASDAKAKAKAKSRGKPNWRLFDFNALVPKFSQALVFVAVAQLDTWEFSLENVEAQQSLESQTSQHSTSTSSSSPFTATPCLQEDDDSDVELQAALLASQADA